VPVIGSASRYVCAMVITRHYDVGGSG
jgi:hypothetical protein